MNEITNLISIMKKILPDKNCIHKPESVSFALKA